MRKPHQRISILLAASLLTCTIAAATADVKGQNRDPELATGDRAPRMMDKRGSVRPVTIPITVRFRHESKEKRELEPVGDITVREDGEPQKIISQRGIGASPLTLAVLIQDGVVPSVGSDVARIADFVRHLPRGSRVMVGYIRPGSLQVQQKFTNDLERAASSMRAPIPFASASSANTYIEIIEGLRRFDSQPTGRRAILVVSDGLDTSQGLNIGPQSLNLERAIKEAQRRSVAVYAFYAPTFNATSGGGSQLLVGNAQGSLERLAEETGGRAFFQGTGAPVSFEPYLRDLATSLSRQIAVTYLSTHTNKGYHRIQVQSDRPDIEIDHPTSYTR
jgi:VWFA-related protein